MKLSTSCALILVVVGATAAAARQSAVFSLDAGVTVSEHDVAAALQKSRRAPGFHELTVVHRGREGHDVTTKRLVFVPDDMHADVVLGAMRRRFVGRKAYGFGGVVLGCAPRWENFYAADVAFDVRDVVRDRGTVASLATGTMAAWASSASTRYFAADPLRFVVTLPRAKSYGSNYRQGRPSGPCPAILLADWQVDRTITTSPPPRAVRFGSPPGRLSEVRVGQSRAEVAWVLGYPTGFAPMSTVRAASHWDYDRVPLESFSVSFEHDRVVSRADRSVRLP